MFGIEPLAASTTIPIHFISLLTLFIHACSFILLFVYRRSSSIIVHRRSFIFCLYISPRLLSFTLVTSFISYCAYHLLVKQDYSTYLVILNIRSVSQLVDNLYSEDPVNGRTRRDLRPLSLFSRIEFF